MDAAVFVEHAEWLMFAVRQWCFIQWLLLAHVYGVPHRPTSCFDYQHKRLFIWPQKIIAWQKQFIGVIWKKNNFKFQKVVLKWIMLFYIFVNHLISKYIFKFKNDFAIFEQLRWKGEIPSALNWKIALLYFDMPLSDIADQLSININEW